MPLHLLLTCIVGVGLHKTVEITDDNNLTDNLNLPVLLGQDLQTQSQTSWRNFVPSGETSHPEKKKHNKASGQNLCFNNAI